MDTQSNQSNKATNVSVKKRRSSALAILGAVILVFVVAAIWIPHNMVSRVARDEVSAVKSLRALTNLELQYAAAHPSKGFTCDFALLKTEPHSSGEQIQEGFLVSEGYKISLTGCEADPNGITVRYRATAVPLLPGKTGFRAFCTDQTGELRYGNNGSVESCRPL
jgi:type IV pilus assembly protein PilA